jgi:DNA primase
MTNDVIDFLKKLAAVKHGSVEQAMFSITGRAEVSCRCPYCLDSIRNRRKKRFYFSLKDGLFFCHNCGRKGNLAKLLHDFRNLPGVNYEALEKDLGLQKVRDFIDGQHRIQEQEVSKREWNLEFPDGARLDTLIQNKVYKKLPQEDKQALAKVIKYLGSRGIKKEWFRYFYFVFPGEPNDQYILTLFEHQGDWVWSGRKIDTNRTGPKYLHLQGFPFHEALGFANEVSTTKGDIMYVVESWFSALLLNQSNLNAVCVFGLNQMKYSHPPLEAFRKKYEIVFVPDNDESLQQFYDINKQFARKAKIILQPAKDVGDFAADLGEKFRKEFLKLPLSTVYNQIVLDGLKTII